MVSAFEKNEARCDFILINFPRHGQLRSSDFSIFDMRIPFPRIWAASTFIYVTSVARSKQMPQVVGFNTRTAPRSA